MRVWYDFNSYDYKLHDKFSVIERQLHPFGDAELFFCAMSMVHMVIYCNRDRPWNRLN